MLPDWLTTMYFASTELSATDLCFLLYQETATHLMLKMPPDVLFLLNGLPSQSASVKLLATNNILLYQKVAKIFLSLQGTNFITKNCWLLKTPCRPHASVQNPHLLSHFLYSGISIDSN